MGEGTEAGFEVKAIVPLSIKRTTGMTKQAGQNQKEDDNHMQVHGNLPVAADVVANAIILMLWGFESSS